MTNNNCISNNTASGNFYGFNLYKSPNNTFTFNSISNNHHGIWFEESCNNTIANNSVSFNNLGIFLWVSSIGNIVVNNTISQNNGYSIEIFFLSDNNLIYHNNFIDNYYFGAYDNCTNSWDNGYPDGGNYWSDYSGIDENNGPSQDIPGSDGIGDAPFTDIDGGNGAQDYYPLMNPIGFPFVLLTQPFSDETDVLSGTNVIAVFNKSMDTSVIPILTQTTGIPIIYTFQGWGQTNVANDTATWTHGNWAQNELITLTISNYQDLQGNVGFNHTFSFTSIDLTKPVSSVNSIDNEWKNTSPLIIEATASDGIGSGVANVTLWYRYSAYNSIWGIWKSFGTNIVSPWNWNFNFPDGLGYYEFYTIAYDKKDNSEDAPASADTYCGYDTAKPKITENNPTSGTTGDYYQLQADVTDNLGLSAVHLIYQYGNGTMVNTTMTNITATNYEFDITISPNNLNVLHYRIAAVDKAGNWNTSVVKDVTIHDNDNPIASTGSNQTVNEGTIVTFSGSGSTDNIGITNYTWTLNFDLGNITLYGVSPSYIFTVAGNYTVTLTVRDATGNAGTDTMLVTVNSAIAQSTDTDGDGVPDDHDAFPEDSSESVDTDDDGVGDNSDAFPNDPDEFVDTDDDGIGNNADTDDDGDNVPDAEDPDQLDSNITGESGIGDYWWIILIIVIVLTVIAILGLKMMRGKKIDIPEQKEPVDESFTESPGKKDDTGP